MNGYEQSQGFWVDSTGNELTYLPWCKNEPNQPMKARFLGLWEAGCQSDLDDEFGVNTEHIVCVKCSAYYPTPSGYSCLETDFGIVVIKLYNQKMVSAVEARNICAADAEYVHLPMPENSAQNMWYVNYAKKLGTNQYWLGINDATVEGEWRTDNDDLQTFLPWKSGLEVTQVLYGPIVSDTQPEH